MNYQNLCKRAKELLEENTIKYGEHYIFRPDKDKYPFQAYWDSGFQAIVAKHFSPERAKAEVYSLHSKQMEDGRIPYQTNWERLPLPWPIFHRITNWIGEDRRATISTLPPVLGFVVWDIYEKTQDKRFIEKAVPPLVKEMEYIAIKRDLLGDGLTSIINNFESGTDEAPFYDEIMNIKGRGFTISLQYYIKAVHYMRHYKKVDFDIKRIKELGYFIVEDLCNNSILCRSLYSLSKIFKELGDEENSLKYLERAKGLARSLEELCWDDGEKIFWTRYLKSGEKKLSKVKTVSSLLPIFTGLIDKEKVAAMVEKHIKNESEFWTEYPLSYVSKDEPKERPEVLDWAFPVLWRGCTWVNMNWLIAVGLLEYGYLEVAREITQRTVQLISKAGRFYEFFNTHTGQGYGGRKYGWSTLVVDLLDKTGIYPAEQMVTK